MFKTISGAQKYLGGHEKILGGTATDSPRDYGPVSVIHLILKALPRLEYVCEP